MLQLQWKDHMEETGNILLLIIYGIHSEPDWINLYHALKEDVYILADHQGTPQGKNRTNMA